MSERDVELVRHAFSLFREGRYDAWIDTFTEDAEIPALALVGSEPVYRGGDGLRRWLAELEAGGTLVRPFDDAYVDVGDGRVAVRGRMVVEQAGQRGFGSVVGWVYALRGEKVCRIDLYAHPNLALEAVGLPPAS